MKNDKKTRVAEKLSAARSDLFQFARDLHEGDWTRPIYTHGEEWTAQDVLRHLAWAEGGMTRLIQQIRQGHKGVAEDFDLDRYNAGGVEKLKEKTPAELMAMMDENRERTLQLLEELSDKELALEGRHASGNIMSVEAILRLIGLHERQHLRDLQQSLTE